MAEPQPQMTSGQGGSTEPKEPLQQPQGAVEMKKIDSAVPEVPAKDEDPATADGAASSASVKGKEKEVPPPSNRQDRADSLSIGARHPYKIDDKYLAKRNVEVPEVTETGKKDPFSVSVYKLKELILREWRDEWEGKPASPSSIRLIHFGKLLDDKEQLKKYQFSREIPNVVHMSVKPAEMVEEDEAGKGKSGSSGGRNSEGGSGCCVIL
ncbi:hypothetical protein UCDDA912_g04587 [Diaporthe ampelina]|uniref:UBL3-like ubiquitin domain-containing protein n=1 Tax=Diaporthe ampelina TaxID=1214573 RepID=A0A0G2HK70_9PEZI|nr:hypothetical protein UCDDA912_g04587 [Diaporthe ampelina]